MADRLRNLLKLATKEYPRRKAAAMKQVRLWEWATRADREIEPVYFERHGFPRGRRLPKAIKGCVSYGLDALGRVVVDKGDSESLYSYDGNRIFWVHYQGAHQAVAVNEATVEEGRVVSIESRGTHGGYSKRFVYQDGVLAKLEDTYLSLDGKSWLTVYQIAWDELGRLASIREKGGDFVYRAAKKGEALKDLLAALEKQLVEEIPARVRRMKLKEPAFSVVIAFDIDNDPFPPTVGVGLETERAELWNVGDYDHYDTSFPKSELTKKANQEIVRKNGAAATRRTYAEIARKLRALDWSKILPVTDDFVVFAADFENTGLEKILREAAGPKTFALWKKQGRIK